MTCAKSKAEIKTNQIPGNREERRGKEKANEQSKKLTLILEVIYA